MKDTLYIIVGEDAEVLPYIFFIRVLAEPDLYDS